MLLREAFIDKLFYQRHVLHFLLLPLSFIYRFVMAIRKACYRYGLLTVTRLPVPVVVVGNITVGGTGKTPLVIYLCKFFHAQGIKVGVISRGYGGHAKQYPLVVTPDSLAQQVGDEPLLIARRTSCPVVVDPCRPRAAKHLLAHFDCDLIISDDGLQHYAMARDIEIAVFDASRQYGNGFCLPAGPCREARSRLSAVDFVVENGGIATLSMQMQADKFVNLHSKQEKPIHDFKNQCLQALCAIGNPKRFYDTLRRAGLDIEEHSYPDHFQFTKHDFNFKPTQTIVMTEKDAVKCESFATQNMWYLPITATLPAWFGEKLMEKVSNVKI